MFSEFFLFFSSLCALWQLSFELSARTHSPDIASARPRSAHGRFWALSRCCAGCCGKRTRFHRRKSPTCGLFSATTSSSANGSLRCPAGVGQAVGRWKDASSRWSAGVDNAAPSRPTWGVEGAKRQNNIQSCAGAIG